MDESQSGLNGYDTLVLSSGGMKGFLHLGALFYFYKHNLLDKIKKYSGCSVGAIICYLLNLGYTVIEILYFALKYEFFKNVTIDINSIKNNSGIISMEYLKTILRELTLEKYGRLYTLKELYDMTKKTLIIATMNMTKGCMEYLSIDTHPNLNCIDAITFSCNIPLVFYKIEYSGSVYFDGAFGDPYPVSIVENDKILGVYIENIFNDKVNNNNMVDLLFSCLTFSLNQITKNTLHSYEVKNDIKKGKHIKISFIEKNHFDIITGIDIDNKVKMIIDGFFQTESQFNF